VREQLGFVVEFIGLSFVAIVIWSHVISDDAGNPRYRPNVGKRDMGHARPKLAAYVYI
jgi:hypothetical protein